MPEAGGGGGALGPPELGAAGPDPGAGPAWKLPGAAGAAWEPPEAAGRDPGAGPARKPLEAAGAARKLSAAAGAGPSAVADPAGAGVGSGLDHLERFAGALGPIGAGAAGPADGDEELSPVPVK